MTTRYVRNVRRTGATALLVATLAFSAAACGGDNDGGSQNKGPSSSAVSAGGGKAKSSSGETPPETTVLVTVKGDSGIEMVINTAKRDSGGFLTVNGQFKNTGSGLYTTPIQWSGQESAVAATGRSLAAMTLVDAKAKKRYYVLRDTDNRPLTTSGYEPSIGAGETLTFFAQFPAPDQSTNQVDLQFPGFPNATIEIS